MVLFRGGGIASCLVLAIVALGAFGSAAEPQGAVSVLSTQSTADGMQVALSIAPPELNVVNAKDGKSYTKVGLKGCGSDNAVGRPALPVISHTVEVPWGAQATVTAQALNLSDQNVAPWVYPHQPPVPKVSGPAGDPPFVIDLDYYTGAKAAGMQKSLNGGEPVVTAYKKRGHEYLNILVRPFAYDPVKGVLQSPGQVQLDIAWTVNPLPKAAGPRTGTISVVEITLGNLAELDALTREGFDISNRQGNVATLYVTDGELEALRQKGYAPKVIEQQPRPTAPKSESGAKALGVYHTYATLTSDLQAYAAAYPSICRLSSLGASVQGRQLWAMKITDNPDVEEDEPEIKYVANIHGDEPVGLEMCMYFIDLLLSDYGTTQRITDLVDNDEIWIVPSMNPDGLEANTRYNASGVDLNRSFPDGAETYIGNTLYGPSMNTLGLPVEVVHMMQWSAAHRFVVSANFHGGSLVVNYPFDNDGLGSVFSPSPDETLFATVSRIYSVHNLPMWNSLVFVDGVTNGAAWYTLIGGMQDWQYRYMGCNEMTIELSNNKEPSASELPTFWSDNEESMLSYLESVDMGVRGIVTDAVTGLPASASVKPVGIEHMVYTDPDVGDYHRPLLPGTYALIFSAPGYLSKTVEGVVVSSGGAARLDVAMTPSSTAHGSIVLVANTAMDTAAAEFRSQKVSEGFEVYNVPVTTGASADTVRTQIRNVYNAYHPDYAIILGDTSSVPTFTATDGSASDLLYALMDVGETFVNYLGKDLIVGRVSVDTGAVVSNYTGKLAAFDAGAKHRDMTWISNGNDPSQYAIAEGTHNWVIANALPDGYTNQTFYQGVGTAADVSAHINAGTDGIAYSGHGSEYGWQGYGYGLTALTTLVNDFDAPVVFGHCCVTGSFALPTCFAEAWLETTARGVAYVGASNNTYWDEDDLLERQEFQAMKDTQGLALGNAVEYGLMRVNALYPASGQYYSTIYHVFGDPTVSLFGPGGLSITTNATLPMAYTGESYSAAVTAISGVAPYTWRLASGTLPDGLSFDASAHRIVGTPTTPGASNVTIEVEDLLHTIVSKEFHLSVVNRFSITTPSALPTAVYGHPYHAELASTGGTAPASWKLAVSGNYTEDTSGTNWVGGGAAQGWHDDDGMWPLTLPWPFTFYGEDYTTVNVCSNGYLDFASTYSDYLNSDEGLKSNVRIAVLWQDLTTQATSDDIFVTQAADYVVIRWSALTFTGFYPINAEVILYRNGNIRFDYGASHYGLDPTIGISSGNGAYFTLSQRNGWATIGPNQTSLFTPPTVLPPGLSFLSTGVIEGTTFEKGDFSFTINAKDSGVPQQSASRAFTLRVAEFEWLEVPHGSWNEVGGALNLGVRVDGVFGNVAYQWVKDGEDIAGATDATLSIDSLILEDQGWYSCRVTDESKATYTSVPVLIQVFPVGSLPALSAFGLCAALGVCVIIGARKLRRSAKR